MSEQKTGIVLPTVPREPTHTHPRDMVIYGKPKSGKTTAVMSLENVLLVDVENGSAFVKGMVIQPPANYGPVGKFKWLKELAATIKEQGKPYDYVVIDTLSQLDSDAEWVGTYNYMNSISGKKFNKQLDDNGNVMIGPDKKPIPLAPNHPDYESVLTLGQGYGYKWTRDAIMDIYESLKDIGKICTIFICHVADKMVAEKNGEQVMVKDLALVGKTRDLIPRLTDAIANVWNEDGQMYISFAGNPDKIGGMRGGSHLANYSGPLSWDMIFKKEEKKA